MKIPPFQGMMKRKEEKMPSSSWSENEVDNQPMKKCAACHILNKIRKQKINILRGREGRPNEEYNLED
jgi:hypothetical protein